MKHLKTLLIATYLLSNTILFGQNPGQYDQKEPEQKTLTKNEVTFLTYLKENGFKNNLLGHTNFQKLYSQYQRKTKAGFQSLVLIQDGIYILSSYKINPNQSLSNAKGRRLILERLIRENSSNPTKTLKQIDSDKNQIIDPSEFRKYISDLKK